MGQSDRREMSRYSWRLPGTNLRISKPRITLLALREHVRMWWRTR